MVSMADDNEREAPHQSLENQCGAAGAESIPAVNQQTGFLSAALWWAVNGFAVMPLLPGTNRPHAGLGSGYAKTANDPARPFVGTTDLRIVAGWWSRWPAANIGVITGSVSRLVVIDCDGPEGVDTFLGWCAANGVQLDCVPYETTPSRGGGRHYFFSLDHPLKSGDWLPAVEVKADGFHVAVAPSVRRLVLPDNDPKSPKDSISELYVQYAMTGDPRTRQMMPQAVEMDFQANGGRTLSRAGSRAETALEGVEHYLENGLPVGGRDNTALALARSLLNRTNGDLNATTAILRAVWERTPQQDFGWRQAEKCIRQAYDYWRADVAALPAWRWTR